MMKQTKFIILFFVVTLGAFTLMACQSTSKNEREESGQNEQEESYSLADFYSNKASLNAKVNGIYAALNEDQRIAQMIMPAAGRLGKPDSVINELVRSGKVGGVLLLNGDMEGFTLLTKRLNTLAMENGHLPLLFSADAEPSLVNRKIKGTKSVPKTAEIKDIDQLKEVSRTISDDLKRIGIQLNFAPVVDLSTANAAITNRSFGSDADEVSTFAEAFILTSQEAGIATTIKHFPGHGLVTGDTHSRLVYIDGEMKEIGVYKPLIDAGVAAIMVGHIAVKNSPYDTDHKPATCSRNIVTDLLKNELNFQGIVVTDALNMGAVSQIPNASMLSVEAGNDLILMPLNEEKLHDKIRSKARNDQAFAKQVEESVKKILRLKLCLGVIS